MSFMDIAQILGNLGEFIGAIVIVATLLYLAMQVRQNTIATRTQSEEQYAHRILDFYHPVALDRQAAEWWARGAENFAELDSIDQQRLILWETSAFRIWFYLYLARKRGALSDEFWENLLPSIKRFGKRESVKVTWQEIKLAYNDEFQHLMDGLLRD